MIVSLTTCDTDDVECYTVTVTRTPKKLLLIRCLAEYDADGDGEIDLDRGQYRPLIHFFAAGRLDLA